MATQTKNRSTTDLTPLIRITLLTVLGYEALGCLTGGVLLVAAPDGRYMDMPVDIMNGVFSNFLIPGIILFGLGILGSFAFFSVLKKKPDDWFLAGLTLGGLLIWFIVEIIILQELHWLHLMWGLPVLLGWTVAIPLIVLRMDSPALRRGLLSCGMYSSLWYLALLVFVPTQYEGYSSISVTVSELSAIGAPTRILWVVLAVFYVLFLMGFGWGIINAAGDKRRLRIAGILILAYCILNFYWPPMHQREVIAAGGGTISDTLHLVWASITLIFNMLLMGFGMAALGKKFRIYTIATWAVFLIFGFLTFMESPGIDANLPTPYIGLWERINMGAFMVWIAVFGVAVKNWTIDHRQKPV